MKRDVPGLWKLEAGAEMRVVADLQPFDWGNWEVGEDGIYYIARAGSEAHLLRYDVATGDATEVGVRAIVPRHPSMALGPGDHYVLLSSTDRTEADIHLVRSFR